MSRDTKSRKPPKPSEPAPRKNTKVTGERSEAAFLSRAANLELGIAKPWGDSRRYDFIVDNGSCLHRVQVKCTESIRARAYETRATYTVGKRRAVYTKKDIDFIAAHVVPLDIWYIIPVEVCTPAPMLRFYPHRKAKRMRLEPYREAWHYLQPPDDNSNIEIHAVADETIYSDESDAPKDKAEADSEKEHVGTGRIAFVGSTTERVGADASVRPAERSSASGKQSGCPAAQMYRAAAIKPQTAPVHLPKSAAPWPIPPLRILIIRKGKRILPEPGSQ